jgi:hypothetical protein
MTQRLIPSVAELLSQSRPTVLLLIFVKMVRVCGTKCLLLQAEQAAMADGSADVARGGLVVSCLH